jgi:hypothetical protein
MSEKRTSALTVEETLTYTFQLGIMRNVERELSRQKRRRTPNWLLVRDYLLGHTSHGGSTSCFQHCHYLGVDPEGYSFWKETPPPNS